MKLLKIVISIKYDLVAARICCNEKQHIVISYRNTSKTYESYSMSWALFNIRLLHKHDPVEESMIGPLQNLKAIPLHGISIIIAQSLSLLHPTLAARIVEYSFPYISWHDLPDANLYVSEVNNIKYYWQISEMYLQKDYGL